MRENGLIYFKMERDMFGVPKNSRVVKWKEGELSFKLKYVLGAGTNGFELTEQF